MASIRSYPNGAGGSTGADFAVLKPTYQSGNYWYVGNAVAGASDSNAGSERSKPLATTLQAYTNAAANDTIVYLASHNESIAASLNVAKLGLSFVGEGVGASRPRLTCSGTVHMFSLNASGLMFDNIYFPASTAAATSRIRVFVAPSAIISNCQFDCGVNDTNQAILFTSYSAVRMSGVTFTSVGATPAVAIATDGGSNSGLFMDNVTFDGGSFGWSDYAWKATLAPLILRATRIYQLNGSHILLPTGTTGTLQIAGATGDSRVDWTP